MPEEKPIDTREADQLWARVNQIEKTDSERRHELAKQMQIAISSLETTFRAELGKKDAEIERIKQTTDERISTLEKALAIAGGISKYQRWLIGTVLVVLGIAAGLFSGRVKV